MSCKTKTMKAGQWDPKEKKVVINRVPIPEPGLNEMIVKIESASLCHTDIMAIDRPELEEPFTLGHEGAGIVHQIHPSVQGKEYKIGDAIGFLYILGCCFECEGCMVHNRLCLNGKPEMQGWTQPGFFAEYAVVHYRNAIHLPEHWDLKTSSVFFCAGVTGMIYKSPSGFPVLIPPAFHAVDSCVLQPGQWLGVIGAGGLGQLAIQYAKAMGLNVVTVDINGKTLEVCKSQGADAIFNSMTDGDYASTIKNITNGGVHAAAVFSNAKPAYSNALNIIRVGGLLMVIGLPYDPLEVSTVDLAMGKYRIKSESTGIPQRLKKAIDFSAKHGIKPEVQLRNLEELNDMVQEMRAGTSTKRMAVTFD